MVRILISLMVAAIPAVMLTFCSKKMLQIYQLSSYKTLGFFGWIKRTGGEYLVRYFALAFFQFISMLIFCFSFQGSYLRYIGLVIYIVLAACFIVLQLRQKQKTPLKITKRIIRQLVILSILYLSLAFLVAYLTYNTAINYSLIAVLTLIIPIFVIFSHFLALPVESIISAHYIKKAKSALKSDIIKIGITGSFGKTTSKNILAAMLMQKYKVLASPASHNTPMGICKLINGGIEGYQVLIAEMGARQKGDIAELCDIVAPDYGIITVTGAAHLETFGSIDEVVKTKLELARNCNTVVINSDDIRLMEAASLMISGAQNQIDINSNQSTFDQNQVDMSQQKRRFLYSGKSGADASYFGVSVSKSGTTFTLNVGGKSVTITTVLLGRHIPAMFAQCAVLAVRLGVTMEQIVCAAATIKPIPHRLQLIKTANATIIDDAYNANPEGAKNALEVLSLFEGAKVLITPGFVEMGSRQAVENRNLGEKAAKSADYLISVGSKDISTSAIEAGMDESRVFDEVSLAAATDRLATLSLSNPVVLFLNDLPDNY